MANSYWTPVQGHDNETRLFDIKRFGTGPYATGNAFAI
jgi:hypothetical protein